MRQYAYAQALQFLIFAVAGPALLVLDTPWRSRPPTWRPGSGGRPRGPVAALRSGWLPSSPW
jgi:hypothetical protein